MDFQDAIKALRQELGVTQVDIAKALHISAGTVSRWELGSHCPNRSVAIALIRYAESHGASKECISRLKQNNKESVKRRQKQYQGDLFSIEHASLEELVECVSFPIYVCDIETDELLYLNRTARQIVSTYTDATVGKKCFVCIMRRDTPCEFCHKADLKNNEFLTYDAFRPYDGTSYRVQGKLIRWNGHNAQIRCISNVGQAAVMCNQEEREQNYRDFLSVKASASSDCLAMAHLNLSRNTVSDIMCKSDFAANKMKDNDADQLLETFKRCAVAKEEQSKFDIIRDRTAVMNAFYAGQTHISIRHYLNEDERLFETTLDLLQNPVTYDIEAVAVLRPISNSSLAEEVSSTLLRLDYEAIVLINAVTGETHSITNGQIDDVIMEQKAAGNQSAGVGAFLRKYCLESDGERVVSETCLPNVIRQLKRNRKYSVIYSLKIGEKIARKRIVYAYLDLARPIILCTVQDISETYTSEKSPSAGRDGTSF